MTIDHRHMEVFLAVSREGSLGRASRALNLTQPAVSKSIRRLENQLQVKLFDRSPRGMVATEYAEALMLHAELISSEMTRALEEIRALRGVSKGRILVGATPSIISGVLPIAVGRLLRQRPGLAVQVVEAIEDGLLQALLKGEIDLAVVGAMRRIRDQPVVSETLYTDKVSVVCRADHPLCARGSLRLEDLLDYPWVLPERENVMWRRLSEFFYDQNLSPPDPAVETTSASFMKAMVSGTDYLTYLPRSLIRDDEAGGRLRVLSPGLATWNRQVIVIRRKKGSLPLAAAALIEELRQIVRESGTLLPFGLA